MDSSRQLLATGNSPRCNSASHNENFFRYSSITQYLTLIKNFQKQPRQNLYSLQNQKLGSDFVLNQSTTTSSAQTLVSQVQEPASRVQRPQSSIQNPASRAQRPESSVQLLRPASRNSKYPLFLNSKNIIHARSQLCFFQNPCSRA